MTFDLEGLTMAFFFALHLQSSACPLARSLRYKISTFLTSLYEGCPESFATHILLVIYYMIILNILYDNQMDASNTPFSP